MIAQLNGQAAGQTVFTFPPCHAPRVLSCKYAREMADFSELEALAARIKAAME